ncbi:MAG: hypothetical protein QOK49_2190 [Baekduia sp.]|jgi:hypothetical protein|nr:hypothetical protein [Baekduia sp.]
MRPHLLAGAACALTISACGGGSAGPSAAVAPVHLAISAPSDMGAVHAARVTVRGTVRPSSATVTVRGHRAAVAGGTWSSDVDLAPGVNVIDVLASAGDARPALTALRVRRFVQVTVPDVTGLSVADATKQLKGRGLKADVQTAGGGFFDNLLGAKPSVCQTTPSAGAQVDPGASIVVTAAPRC